MNDLSASTAVSELEPCTIKNYIPQADTDSEATIIQAYHPLAKKVSPILDDTRLIQRFSEGETQLLANQNLRLEFSCNAVQLTTRKGELIGILKPKEKNFCLIKQSSKYWEIIHKTLLDKSFIPLGESEQQKGFFEYQQYEVPKGYKINYTEAGFLWKIWWPSQRRKNNYQIQLSIIVFTKDKWYPIQEIAFVDGIFYIKTLIGEMTLGFTDKVVWLNKLDQEVKSPAVSLNQVSETATQPVAEDSYPRHVLEKNPMVPPPLAAKLEVEPDLQKILQQLKNQAIKTLANYLANGEIETITEVIKDAKGEVTSTKTVTSKKP